MYYGKTVVMTSSEESQIGEKPPLSNHDDSKLLLTGDEALARARASPNDRLPISITYSHDDKDNPRNWPKWRKWYITIMVSMLNVITYVFTLRIILETVFMV